MPTRYIKEPWMDHLWDAAQDAITHGCSADKFLKDMLTCWDEAVDDQAKYLKSSMNSALKSNSRR